MHIAQEEVKSHSAHKVGDKWFILESFNNQMCHVENMFFWRSVSVGRTRDGNGILLHFQKYDHTD